MAATRVAWRGLLWPKVLKILLARRGYVYTTKALAKDLDCEPIVALRVLEGLRARGFVRSERTVGIGRPLLWSFNWSLLDG